MFSQHYCPITTLPNLAYKKVIISHWVALFEVVLSDCVVLGFVLLALTRQLIGVCLVDL